MILNVFGCGSAALRYARLGTFRLRLARLWHTQLVQRSQRRRLTWERMNRLVDRWLPRPRVLHPWPTTRFAASHPR